MEEETKHPEATSAAEEVAPSLSEIARTDGNETKDELEKRKLRLEILTLARPWWSRPQSIAAIIGFVVAIGGWITTAVYSNIDAKLEFLDLRKKIVTLETQKQTLGSEVELLRHEQVTLIASLKREPAHVAGGVVLELSGSVVDGITDEPIANALVEAVSLDNDVGVVRGVTGADGQFSLSLPDVSQIKVTARKSGFISAHRNVIVDGEQQSIEIELIRIVASPSAM
jgi:hypothetical protein